MMSFIRFSRPHTVIGTVLSIVVLFLIAASLSDQHIVTLLPILGWTLLACLGANIYIVGLNQITDIDIDRINKPYLPLASGAISLQRAYWWIGVSLIIALAISLWQGKYLLLTVLLSLLLGTIYSLPPIRLKRYYFWAAFCIIAVRGLIVNLLLFLHLHYQINGLTQIPAIIWLLTSIIFLFSMLIAWFKDMPDVEGDAQYQIKTLSIQLGTRKVLWIGTSLLLIAFMGLMLWAWLGNNLVNPWFFSGIHLTFMVSLFVMARRVQLSQRQSLARFYLSIWVLFFLEYITFGLANWIP